ncbi:MAG: isoprenylcysteine carboxylmethyltransferase family protein [Candidatus Aminicenantes bacterium]|nr:isoprenylcysteine carboxylmethyltransferase family protein [Candidatus Aminicenantes bacterium]
MTDFIRHIIGYIVGASLFLIIIPFGLYELSLLDRTIPFEFPARVIVRLILSLPFFLPGLFFVVWSNIFLFEIGKGGPTDGFNIAISPRTKHLVVSGPYRLSRNPMVWGAFLVYFSIGLFLLSILCLIALAVFLGLGVVYLKKTEEKRLLKDFGEAFADYRRNVPMIFPKIRLKTAKRFSGS